MLEYYMYFRIVTCRGAYRRGFDLNIALIDRFNIQLVILFNYSATSNFHTFPARSVYTSSCLVTASNSGYSSASGLHLAYNSSARTE
jgi:hypothetical protein